MAASTRATRHRPRPEARHGGRHAHRRRPAHADPRLRRHGLSRLRPRRPDARPSAEELDEARPHRQGRPSSRPAATASARKVRSWWSDPQGIFYPRLKPRDVDRDHRDQRGRRRRRRAPALPRPRRPASRSRTRRTSRSTRCSTASCSRLNGNIDPHSIDDYLARGGYTRPRQGARRGRPGGRDRRRRDERPARPRRRRLPHRPEVALLPRQPRREAIHHLQRRRGRPRRVHGPLRARGQPALRDRGHAHRRLRHRRRRARDGYVYVRHEYPFAVERLRLRPAAGARARPARRRTSSAPASASTSASTRAPAPSSAASPPRSRPPSRATAACRAASTSAPWLTASGASRPTSTTSRRYANVPWIMLHGADAFARHGHGDQQGHQDLLAHRQGRERRPRRGADGRHAARGHLRHRRRHAARPRVQGRAARRAVRRLPARRAPRHADRLREPHRRRLHDGLRRHGRRRRHHLHGRLRQVLPQVHGRGELRQVRALPRRHHAHARDPRAHHRRPGHAGRRRAARAAQRRRHRGLALRARRQRPQPRAHHAALLPRRGHGARGRQALPGQGLPPAHPLHHRQGRLHRLPRVLRRLPHAGHHRRAQAAPRHRPEALHQVRHLPPGLQVRRGRRRDAAYSRWPKGGRSEPADQDCRELDHRRQGGQRARAARPCSSVARREGIDIPALCHQEGMAAWGACRLCIVEVEGQDKLQAACTTWVADGLVVHTDTPARARQARELPQDVPLGPQRLLRGAVLARLPHAHRHPRLHQARSQDGDSAGAAAIVRDELPFPGILGRVCPRYCEPACRRGEVDEPIAICALHRAAGDHAAAALHRRAGHRPARGRHRRRPGRPQLRLVPGAGRPRGHHLRHQRQARRHAALQHPRVPPAREGARRGARSRSGTPACASSTTSPSASRSTPTACMHAGFDAIFIGVGAWQTSRRASPATRPCWTRSRCCATRRRQEGPARRHRGRDRRRHCGPRRRPHRPAPGRQARHRARPARRGDVDAGARDLRRGPRRRRQVRVPRRRPPRKVKSRTGKAAGRGVRAPAARRRRQAHRGQGLALRPQGRRPSSRPLSYVPELGESRRAQRSPPGTRWRPTTTPAARQATACSPPATPSPAPRRRSTPSPAASAPPWPSTPGCGGADLERARGQAGRLRRPALPRPARATRPSSASSAERLAERSPVWLKMGIAADRGQAGHHAHTPARQAHGVLRRGREGLSAAGRPGRGHALPAVRRAPATAQCDLQKLGVRVRHHRERPGGQGRPACARSRPRHEHPFIRSDMDRCIACGRCVRVCRDVAGPACYDFTGRGFTIDVDTPYSESLQLADCITCGRCVTSCPTGALTFNQRALESYAVDESRCIMCHECVERLPGRRRQGHQPSSRTARSSGTSSWTRAASWPAATACAPAAARPSSCARCSWAPATRSSSRRPPAASR